MPEAAVGEHLMEDRLKKLEAEAEIVRLLVAYANALDQRDYKKYASLFTEDGEWTGGMGSYKTPAAIEQMLIDNIGIVEPGYFNASNFHMVSNPYVEVDGDTATASSMFVFWVRTGGNSPSPQAVLAGRYFDDLVRVDGEWKIKKRVAHNIIPFKDPNNPDAPDPGANSSSAHLTPSSTEARLQRVEDELAIQRLLIEYSARLDAKDIDSWIDVFAKDGTWKNGDQVHKGPKELRELLIRLWGSEPPIDYMQGVSYQIIHGIRVDVDGDKATAKSRHTLLRKDDTGSPKPVLAGIYHDELVREDGQWKIFFRNDYPVIPSREDWEKVLAENRKKGTP